MIATRQDFMSFFRDDDMLSLLTNDDRAEIFAEILSGSSDFTKSFLDEVLAGYGVDNIVIIEC